MMTIPKKRTDGSIEFYDLNELSPVLRARYEKDFMSSGRPVKEGYAAVWTWDFEVWLKFTDAEKSKLQMQFGLESGRGWRTLIILAVREILMLPDLPDDFKIVQIKEKNAQLSIYYSATVNFSEGQKNSDTQKVDEIIRRYTELSCEICELCGMAGKLRERGGWYSIRCEKCEDARLLRSTSLAPDKEPSDEALAALLCDVTAHYSNNGHKKGS
jgi:hypothetical protein